MEKKTQNKSKIGFFYFCKKLSPFTCLFYPKMVHNNVLHESVKTLTRKDLLCFCTKGKVFSLFLKTTQYCSENILLQFIHKYFFFRITKVSQIQKQPSEVFLGKRVLKIFSKFYSRAPMPKYDFSKIAKQLY